MSKIFITSYFASTEFVKINSQSFEYTETDITYRIKKESSFGSKTTLLNKKDLLILDSNLRTDMVAPIQYHCWHFEEDKEMAVYLITSKIKSEIAKRKHTIALLEEYFNEYVK